MTNSTTKKYTSPVRSAEWKNLMRSLSRSHQEQSDNQGRDLRDVKISSAFEENRIYNQILVKEVFAEPHTRIALTTDMLMNLYFYQIGALYASHFFSFPEHEEVNIALTSCFVTGVLGLYTAYDLTNMGLHSPAKMNLRYAFEALFIAKFISLNRSADLFDRWIDGLQTNLTSSVFDRIKSPDVSIFKYFWKELNKFSHATKYIKQEMFNLTDEEIIDETQFNYQLIEALLECFYHLLNSHIIIAGAQYCLKQYGDYERVRGLKSLLKTEFKSAHEFREKGFANLVRLYKLQWITLA